ncbi:topoisomerase DNA-binding C4 zinc finger domain-containing protein [[Ruminococcus] gnavus]|nr:topoisomerase DNA-binding C4 zinc finger domain-containing protein [Mediterraneibacter gnavus]MCZ0630709.1 topoisomerase DNA-binding C4 zinc finger domain-containing protein [Mediterraneibacter gnavus]
MFVCPKCGGEMIRRNGRYGEFWGCGNFPKCRYTQNI